MRKVIADRKRGSRGFTLIELLVVVATIGILAAVAIPNLMSALQKSKQKRTMVSMRNIATAWEARFIDEGSYLPAGEGEVVSWPPTQPLALDEMKSMLVPTYLKEFQGEDGWGKPLEFTAEAASYGIRSAGADRAFDGEAYTHRVTHHFDCDITYMNGEFVVYPDGPQYGSR